MSPRPPLPSLPDARERSGGPAYAVALVCLGNICRSPMAHVVLESALADAGLEQQVTVSSGGTGPWHVGEPMDRRAAAALRDAGLDPSRRRGRQVDPDWFARHDLVLAMDGSNLADLEGLADAARTQGVEVGEGRLRLFRDFDPEAGADRDEREVPDPYYGGDQGFADVLAMVERTSEALVERLALVAGPADRD